MFVFSPYSLENAIAPGLREGAFASPYDGEPETFLELDFRTGEPTPLLVIYLHGAASTQEQGMTAGIYHGAFEEWGATLAERGAVYLCPHYRGGSWLGPAAEAALVELLRLAREHYRPQRVILAGGSMGGTSALIFGALHPGTVDGIYALCPASDPAVMYPAFPEQFERSYGGNPQTAEAEFIRRTSRRYPAQLAAQPLYLVHGDADTVIPVTESRALLPLLNAQGARYRYIELPGGDHNAPINHPLKEALAFLLAS